MLKRFQSAISEVFLFVLGFVMTRTPLWFNRCCSDAIFVCFYPLIRFLLSYDKTLKKNLTMIYGDCLTRRQVRRLAHSCMRNIVRMPGDILYYGSPRHRGRLLRDISITGKEHSNKPWKRARA